MHSTLIIIISVFLITGILNVHTYKHSYVWGQNKMIRPVAFVTMTVETKARLIP